LKNVGERSQKTYVCRRTSRLRLSDRAKEKHSLFIRGRLANLANSRRCPERPNHWQRQGGRPIHRSHRQVIENSITTMSSSFEIPRVKDTVRAAQAQQQHGECSCDDYKASYTHSSTPSCMHAVESLGDARLDEVEMRAKSWKWFDRREWKRCRLLLIRFDCNTSFQCHRKQVEYFDNFIYTQTQATSSGPRWIVERLNY